MRKLYMKIPIEVSARHIHLSQKDLDKLFGRGYKLKKLKNLSQAGEFAAKETARIITKRGALTLRVVGPARQQTQIELSRTDCLALGIKAPLNLSGNLKGAGKAQIVGQAGMLKIKGVIIAKRHIHLDEKTAKKWKNRNGQSVSIKTAGERGVIFENVIIRVGPKFKTAMHIDSDEANAAGINKKGIGEILYPPHD